MTRFAAVLTVVLLAGAGWSFAQEEDHPAPPPPGEQDRPGMRNPERLRKMVDHIMRRLEREDPDKFEEMQQLRDDDPQRFRQEMRRLLPQLMQRGRGGGGAWSRGNFRDDGERRQGGGPRADNAQGWNGPGRRLFADQRRKDPEQFEELRQLYRNNPEEFGRRVRDMVRDKMMKQPTAHERELENKSRELADSYHQAETDAEKAELKTELRAVLMECFAERLKAQEERLQRMNEQLEKMQKNIDARRESRDKIVEKRLNDLLQAPELRW